MKAGHIVIVMAALFPIASALTGCTTDDDGQGGMRVEHYMLEDDEYHRNHSHYPLPDRTIAGFGSH